MAGNPAHPDPPAGRRVDREQVTIDVGEEDLAFVVDRRGDVGRGAAVLGVGFRSQSTLRSRSRTALELPYLLTR
jgi:hypothetical protein